jgi:SAM-dependent methyltransferase
MAGMKSESEYKEKIVREASWHATYDFRYDHFLNSKLLFSFERTLFNYDFPKRQLLRVIQRTSKNLPNNPSVLIAPLGVGQDIPYFKGMSDRITGVDISPQALEGCTDESVKKIVGDVKNLHMFPDNHFDIVAMPLFFHHYVDFGFDDFLKEAYRVAKPGGYFVSLEPGILNPVSLLALLARKFFGNITSIQPDERPFFPSLLTGSMKRAGFRNVKASGAGYCHTRTPIWIAKVMNRLTLPILNFPGLKYLSFMFIFEGTKPVG